MPFCANCGAEVQAGQRFCAHCGAAAETPPAAASAPVAASPGGRNVGAIAAMVALAGFLMPWVSCNAVGKQTVSGLDLASRGELHALWLIPIGMIVALILLLSKAERASAGLVSMAVGIARAAIMLYYYAKLESNPRDQLGFGHVMRQAIQIEYGAIISLAASVVLAVSGIGLMKSRAAPDH